MHEMMEHPPHWFRAIRGAAAIALCASAALLAAGAGDVGDQSHFSRHKPEIREQKSEVSGGAIASDAGQPAAAAPAPQRKTCSEIHFHQALKDSVRHHPEAAQREAFAYHGIEPADLDSELVALYVQRELLIGEVEALRGEGVRILHKQYVPPVAGRHPHGFYLASVDYAALDAIEADDRFVRVSSVETRLEPMNDLGLEEMNVDVLHGGAFSPLGKKIGPLHGSGVAIAVADSGVDLSHPDLPVPVETFDVTTGQDVTQWSTNVANTVIWHGTHVSGSAVGSGAASEGKYAGAAPLADFHFYKIGSDTSGAASTFNIILAVNRAADVGCRIFTLSYGGFDTFMDGSSAVCQAFDSAYEQGMISFSSAGNMGARRRHYSADLEPLSTSAPFVLAIANPFQNSTYTPTITLRTIWQSEPQLGEQGIGLNLLSELDPGEAFTQFNYSVSPRGTETIRYALAAVVEPGAVKTFQFELSNNSNASPDSTFVHLYQISTNNVTFPVDDPHYTVTQPALADTVIAVGAWRHRGQWIDYFGNGWFFQSGDGILAPFSSLGPRIDGQLKPEVVAPGSMTISLREPALANASSQMISSTGANNGTGPADYYTAQGTSMASPIAAGAMALLLEHEPDLTAAEAIARMTASASNAEEPNTLVGHGMIDILGAILLGEPSLPGIPGDLTGDGTVGVEDLLILLAAWGACNDCPTTPCPADLDGDCNVGVSDLLTLLANWG